MPGEPSSGEVDRRLHDVRADLKDDVQDLGRRIDKLVSQEAYDIRHTALVARVAKLEEAAEARERQAEVDRRAAEAQRRSDRRLIFSALIVPVLIVLLQAYVAARGAGS
jgi:hypothetical protein